MIRPGLPAAEPRREKDRAAAARIQAIASALEGMTRAEAGGCLDGAVGAVGRGGAAPHPAVTSAAHRVGP